MTQDIVISFVLNGKELNVKTQPHRRLVDMIRDDLKLKGTKIGCGEGECGACTVLINGQAYNSCIILAPQVDKCEVITIEGLVENGRIHPLQLSFIASGAIQCGFCTPGMILSAKALLDINPMPSEDEVKVALSGNLCRCTGYKKIINAVLDASRLEVE